MNDSTWEWRLRALTDLWTGDAEGKAQRTIPTGLLGSIRWWFEVLIRGLGGAACDPSFEDRRNHPKSSRCPDPAVKQPMDQGHHCVVCELFGCTGWGRKFRFEVRDGSGAVMGGQIKKGTEFILRFTPLRPIAAEEWALLDLTIRLIADYGAIGGKTVYKPSDELALADASLSDFDDNLILHQQVPRSPLSRNDKIVRIDQQDIRTKEDLEAALRSYPAGHRVIVQVRRSSNQQTIEAWAGKRHHQDYGLIQVKQHPEGAALPAEALRDYVQGRQWRKVDDNDFAWASLANFWCVDGKHLARQNANQSTFNKVIGRPEPKGRAAIGDSWLAGQRPDRRRNLDAASKKVFSFKDPRRTFGFVNPGVVTFDQMKRRLAQAWGSLGPSDFVAGDVILTRLTTHGGATP